MKGIFRGLAVIACGLVTTFVAAMANGALARETGIDLFTWSFWIVIPAGAMLCAAVAGSGYALGAEAYADLIRLPIKSKQAGQNAIRFHATLDRCTSCERWLIRDRTEYQTRGSWEALPGARHSWITQPAPGLVRAFAGRS